MSLKKFYTTLYRISICLVVLRNQDECCYLDITLVFNASNILARISLYQLLLFSIRHTHKSLQGFRRQPKLFPFWFWNEVDFLLFVLFFLVCCVPLGTWDLSSLTRDLNPHSLQWRHGVFTTYSLDCQRSPWEVVLKNDLNIVIRCHLHFLLSSKNTSWWKFCIFLIPFFLAKSLYSSAMANSLYLMCLLYWAWSGDQRDWIVKDSEVES